MRCRPVVLALGALVLSTGCKEEPPPKGPVALARGEATAMTVEEAARIVDDLYRASGTVPPPPPTSFEAIVDVLREDRVDAFRGAVSFTQTQVGPRARAVEGQLELSWGEGQLLTAQMVDHALALLADETSKMEMRVAALPAGVSTIEPQLIEHAHEIARRYEPAARALRTLARVHVARGATLAREVAKAAPGDAVTHRLAADLARLEGDWRAFDGAVSILEQAAPGSLAVLYLRAVEAAERRGDFDGARAGMKAAREKDPRFAPAAAHLVLYGRTPEERLRELEVLRSLSPHHAMLVFAVAPMLAVKKSWSGETGRGLERPP